MVLKKTKLYKQTKISRMTSYPVSAVAPVKDEKDWSVAYQGWIDKIQNLKKQSFIHLRMGEHRLQVVVPAALRPEEKDQLVSEAFVEIRGKLQKLPEGKRSFSDHELLATMPVVVLGASTSDFVNQCPEGCGPEVRLEKRHLYLRNSQFALITRLRACLLQAIRQHFFQTKCLEIVPPCFTGVECEGGATLFHVSHPGKTQSEPMNAYLTQSSQFALEMAVPAVGDCYCVYPSFRAENSHTRRHLTEFLHAEAEWSGVLTLSDHIAKLQGLLQGIVNQFFDLSQSLLQQQPEFYHRMLKLKEDVRPENALILSHAEAIEECNRRGILKDNEDLTTSEFGPRDDIPEKQERALIDAIGKVVYLVKFPREFKSFYMALDPLDSSRVLGCDVEVPGVGEIIGSGVREYDYHRLKQRLLDFGLKVEDYSEYLDLRQYGFGRTSGMGLGVDRMLMWLLGLPSIRDVVTFPRFPGYLRP
jgi:asparaginyl-tRNA synthetase